MWPRLGAKADAAMIGHRRFGEGPRKGRPRAGLTQEQAVAASTDCPSSKFALIHNEADSGKSMYFRMSLDVEGDLPLSYVAALAELANGLRSSAGQATDDGTTERQRELQRSEQPEVTENGAGGSRVSSRLKQARKAALDLARDVVTELIIGLIERWGGIRA